MRYTSMRRRAALALGAAFLINGCILHHNSGPSPVKCPPASVPNAEETPIVGHVRLDGEPTPLVRGPYTVVLDDRVVAEVRNADSRAAAKVFRDIDPETIESIEMVRSATGDVLRIRRCYASTAH